MRRPLLRRRSRRRFLDLHVEQRGSCLGASRGRFSPRRWMERRRRFSPLFAAGGFTPRRRSFGWQLPCIWLCRGCISRCWRRPWLYHTQSGSLRGDPGQLRPGPCIRKSLPYGCTIHDPTCRTGAADAKVIVVVLEIVFRHIATYLLRDDVSEVLTIAVNPSVRFR